MCQFLFCGQRKSTRIFSQWKKLGLFHFSTVKFLYPCFSFVPLSLLSLSMLFNRKFWFSNSCIYWLSFGVLLFRDSRYIRHNARVLSVRKSCFVSKILTCSFHSRLSCDVICYNWAIIGYLVENYELLKIPMVRSWLVKNLSTLVGYTTILYWWDTNPHGIFWYLVSNKV